MERTNFQDQGVDEVFDMIKEKESQNRLVFAEACKIVVLCDIATNLECILHKLSKIHRAIHRDEPELIKTGQKENGET